MTSNELETWKRLNECECVKKVFGFWMPGDRWYCTTYKEWMLAGHGLIERDQCDIWVPLLYDPISPERSLIGIYRELKTNHYIKVHPIEHMEHVDRWVWEDLSNIQYRQARPDLAVAKAIIEQEKGEGDGTEI